MDANDKSSSESPGGIWDHVGDLRKVLIRCLIAVGLGLILTFTYSEPIVYFLQKPLLALLPPERRHLYYTGITDKFMVYLQISVLASLALTLPYILSQGWRLIAPALDKSQRKFALPFICMGTISFFVGLSFAYWVLIPLGYKYLIDFGSTKDEALITLTEYFSLTIKILLIAGIVFELPIIMVLLGRFGLVNDKLLRRYRRHAFLAIAIVASIATPSPDAVTLGAVMIPMYLLYEISILGVRFTTKNREKEKVT
jgi:sec-independent protein translocase protein TatC